MQIPLRLSKSYPFQAASCLHAKCGRATKLHAPQAIPHFADRIAVKPGLTGWAQVNYPYGASVEDARQKLAYDLYYLQHRSLLLDLRVLLATIRVVLCGSGAR